jgi:GT2 family glycosyltransferase
MNRFWNSIMLPILKSIDAKYIVEIGSETGVNTINILEYCMEQNGHMTAIDPFPLFDITEFKNKYGDKFEIYQDLSLNVLSQLNDYDAILIDGDHNWYTVYNELKLIEQNFKGKKFPLVFLHDIGWPYARRDLYYNPENIPEEYRQPYEKKGLYPGKSELEEESGLNYFLNNAVRDDTSKNGVLTAVEDFISESELKFSFIIIEAFFGFGILFPRNKGIESFVKKTIANSDLIGKVEKERVEILAKNTSEKHDQFDSIKHHLTENQNQLNLIKDHLNHNQNEISEIKDQINYNQKNIKKYLIDSNKKYESQLDTIISNIYELKYSNNYNRPLKQRFYSILPSFYILSKNKTNLKGALTDIRGYNAIKRQNLLDVGYYLTKYPNVRSSGMDPILHYMYHGFNEGKKPNPDFDGDLYLKAYKDIKKSDINPLVHFSLYGIKEKRSFKPIQEKEGYKAPKIRQFSDYQINNIISALSKKISIIIPIFNAYEQTEKCINSVLEHTNIPFELILVDDCSTDERISNLLNKMENVSDVKVIRNSENIGFVKTSNIGFKNSDGDVVLLNSDTQVTPRWLQKLVVNAYSNERIGTVTPISNSAGVFSVPEMSKKNEIPPYLTIDGMAALVENISENINMEVPTGNGFCMFIKRETLVDVGLFDENNFGRGYGEENDFCMRAIEKSWVNIIDDSTYIFHEESSSFSEKKNELKKRNWVILNKKHPSYEKKVNKFVNSRQFKSIRNNVRKGLDDFDIDFVNKKRILYILHEAVHLGNRGGTGQTNKEIISYIQNKFNCFILTSTSNELSLWENRGGNIEKIKSWKIKSKWSVKDFTNAEFKKIYFDIIFSLNIDIVHIEHLYKHTFDLPEIAKKLGIPIVLSFHDFYYVCPSINLLDANNNYCAGKCTSGNYQCKIPSILLNDVPILKNFIDIWRDQVSDLIDICSSIVAPSQTTLDLYEAIYPQLSEKYAQIIEHGRDFQKNIIEHEVPSKEKPVKILVPGFIANHKGSGFIKKLKDEDHENRLEFHFMGEISPELYGYGIYHGKYKTEDFNKIVDEIKPSFIGIFSICPETYSYTLSEAWSCGIPVLANNIGALEERILKKGGGWLLDYKSPSKAYKEIIRIVNNNQEYIRVSEEVNKIHLRSKNEMGYDYECIYWEILLKNNPYIDNIIKVCMFVNGRKDKFPPATYIRLLLPFNHPFLYGKIVPFIIDEDMLSIIDQDHFLHEKTYDCIIVQRDSLYKSFANFLVQRCSEHDIRLIYEIDDDLLNIEPSHPEYEIYSNKANMMNYVANNADLVIVSTPNLRSQFGNLPNVEVIPNALDERLWFVKPDLKSRKNSENNIKIGYMGTVTHEKDLIMVKNVIHSLKKKFGKNKSITFSIIGGLSSQNEDTWFNIIKTPKTNYPEFVKWLRSIVDWDIAIAPLEDTNINFSKSELKYLEYAALDLPGVYSDVGSYKETIINELNGLLVENNDLNQWENQITKLVEDVSLRSTIVDNSKRNVLENYLLKYRAITWYNTIKNIINESSIK